MQGGTLANPSLIGSPTGSQQSSANSASQYKFQLDQNQPITTLQIRLGDGSRLTQKFNLTHTVGDIRGFINAGNPGMSSRSYVLMTTFPNKDLTDDSATIEEAGLKGSVITQRWT